MITPSELRIRYLYERHSAISLAEWAPTLRFFRYCRAYGGHANDGDQLLVALGFKDRSQLMGICQTLGIPLVTLLPDEPKPVFGKGYTAGEYAAFRIGIKQFPDLQQPGWVKIAGVAAYVLVQADRLQISVADEKDQYEVTSGAIAAARTVEGVLEPLSGLVIDPPQDNRHCICPKYYPEMWNRGK